MRECPRCERCYDDEVLLCPEDSSKTRHTLPGGLILAARYLLEKRLGRGAMGQVYLARDQNLQTRKVAVKTIRPEVLNAEDLQEGEAIARFEREARTAASIRHPNVVDVTDFGKSPEGVFYLVMEYVQGETLYHLLRREGTLSVPRALALLRQVAAGVEAAHEEHILHRDLKPANIFIMQKRKKDGSLAGDGFIKVGDFGLAKIVSGAAAEADSASGGPSSRGIIGTPEYMAPEQMQPGTKLDARADIYALGTITYHMLGGRPPFTGDLAQLIMQKLMNAPPLLSTLRSDIPAEVEHAVMHALERDAGARPASVADWIEELEGAVSESSVHESEGDSRVVILAPSGAEVYVDDERYGSIGRSGRIILSDITPGRHVLRVARSGEKDDERVIEIRSGSGEQIIQAQLRSMPSANQLSPSRDGASGRSHVGPTSAHDVVVCAQCGARFASGVRFCGRCGGSNFRPLTPAQGGGASISGPFIGSMSGGSGLVQQPGGVRCPRCSINYPPGTKFCGRCGTSVQGFASPVNPPRQVELLCLNCRMSYPPGTKFCGRCGGTLKA
ncbi:MAG TPA: protein kinase [Pyrinomonadaceae bacterium]|jgi:serine/threonine protein kinase|nr:protein kinase [Pyrinomonadaceae bacterium]